jgi:hypothetical protein
MVRKPAPIALLTEKDNVVIKEKDGSGAIMDEGLRVSIGMANKCSGIVLYIYESSMKISEGHSTSKPSTHGTTLLLVRCALNE